MNFDIGPLITNLLVAGFSSALTWIFARRQSRYNELDRRIDRIFVHIQRLEEAGCDYWLLEGDHPQIANLEMRIRSISSRVGQEIDHLDADIPEFNFSEFKKLVAFRRAVSEFPFEVVGRPAKRERCLDIQSAAVELRQAIQLSKRRKVAGRY